MTERTVTGSCEDLLDPRRRPASGSRGSARLLPKDPSTRHDQSAIGAEAAHARRGPATSCAGVGGQREHDPVGREGGGIRRSPARAVLIQARPPRAGAASATSHAPPPSTTVSDHTTFFIASAGSNPRAAGGAPSRRGGDGELEAELVGGAHRGVDRLVPRRLIPGAPARARRGGRPCRRRTAALRGRRRRAAR